MIERWLRGLAGIVIIFAIIMYFLHSPQWIWFILFVALNLLQSAFTDTCPAKAILKRLNI
jgi:hypothetical protein